MNGGLFTLDRERVGVIRDLSVLEPYDAVRVLLGKLRIVGDHDDKAVVSHFFEKIHDLHGCLRVQSAGGLVCQQDLGIVDQGSGDRYTLHLAAGHLVGPFVGLFLEPDFLEGVQSHFPALIRGYAANSQGQLDVLQDRLVRDQVVGLKDEADGMVAVGVPIAVLVFLGRNTVAVESSDDIEQGSLSRTARPQDRDELVVAQVEGDIVESDLLKSSGIVFFLYILKLKHYSSECRQYTNSCLLCYYCNGKGQNSASGKEIFLLIFNVLILIDVKM